MKRPEFFTKIYWKATWAGFKASKYQLIAMVIGEYMTLNTVYEGGYFAFRVPGTYLIYYFGTDPALWAFVTGILAASAIGKWRRASLWWKFQYHALDRQKSKPTLPVPQQKHEPYDTGYGSEGHS